MAHVCRHERDAVYRLLTHGPEGCERGCFPQRQFLRDLYGAADQSHAPDAILQRLVDLIRQYALETAMPSRMGLDALCQYVSDQARKNDEAHAHRRADIVRHRRHVSEQHEIAAMQRRVDLADHLATLRVRPREPVVIVVDQTPRPGAAQRRYLKEEEIS